MPVPSAIPVVAFHLSRKEAYRNSLNEIVVMYNRVQYCTFQALIWCQVCVCNRKRNEGINMQHDCLFFACLTVLNCLDLRDITDIFLHLLPGISIAVAGVSFFFYIILSINKGKLTMNLKFMTSHCLLNIFFTVSCCSSSTDFRMQGNINNRLQQ